MLWARSIIVTPSLLRKMLLRSCVYCTSTFCRMLASVKLPKPFDSPGHPAGCSCCLPKAAVSIVDLTRAVLLAVRLHSLPDIHR